MYNSGDAAEQVVRMSLEGAEVALKITGAAAKNLAAALYTVLKDQKKTKGKARIETMLREKRPLKVYTIKKEDCPEFARQAKGYGILYAPIPVRKEDDTIDILVSVPSLQPYVLILAVLWIGYSRWYPIFLWHFRHSSWQLLW